MSFLRLADYATYIQAQQLAQISKDPSGAQTNTQVRQAAESDAIEEASEYLQQKYDVNNIFTDIIEYAVAVTYNANNLVELSGPAWQAQNYTANTTVLYTDGYIYFCILNTTTSQAPGDATYWLKLGLNLQLFYLKYPYPLFDINRDYNVGEVVFWKGYIYQCQKPSYLLGQENKIQFDNTLQYPFPNSFPDKPVTGVQQWGAGIPYSVTGLKPGDTAAPWTAGTYALGTRNTYNNVIWEVIASAGTSETPGTDITAWQPETWKSGDNRNRMLLQQIIHLTIWNLHSNIAPQNVPMLREKKHIIALKWLEDVKKGNKALDALTLPVLQPPKGGRTLIASKPAQQNRW